MLSLEVSDTSPDDDSSNESTSADPLDFATLLSAFISNGNQLLNGGGNELEKKSSRKRCAGSHDVTSAKRRNGWHENGHMEISDELSIYDPHLFFDNTEEVACASGLVDSKAKNKVTCVVCKVEVCNTARQRHVFMVHVKKEDMYQCPECDYLNSNSVWEAKKHCTSQHGKGVEPISNEEKHKSLILVCLPNCLICHTHAWISVASYNSCQMWNKRCFPDWKQKRPQWWSSDENANGLSSYGSNKDFKDTKLDNDEVTAMIREAILRREPNDSIIRDEDRDDSEPRTPAPEGLQIDDRTCHLCWEESRYPGRHIAQKHLKKPLYECPVCEGFGSYEGCTVMKHIHKVHPDCPDAQPISNLERYADEIRDLQNRCFPNRPMKLVRPKESTRPRERHHCKMCGTQVAQSDRQRHVYHRHLQRTRIFECPLCNFASNYDVHRVKWHIKWMHKDDKELEPISHENEYRKEIDQLNEDCFPGWQHRRKPFWWLDNDDKKSEPADETTNDDQPIKHEEIDPDVDMVENGSSHVKEGTPSSTGNDLDDSNFDESLDGSNHGKDHVGQPMKRVSEWTCRLCLKEFKPTSNFLRHVAKDHLDMPLFQCALCEWGAADAYEVKAHMVKTHNNADLDPISNLELNPEHVQQRFSECFPSRKMKPGTFDKKKESTMVSDETKVTCQECFQEMKTEDRQIHVYRHHLKEPRLYECPLCDFSHHACSSDVRAHIKFTHRDNADVLPRANLLQYSQQIAEWNDRCFPGWINRKLPASVMEDFNRCRLCDEDVRQTSRHIAEAHLMIQLHQCPLCEYGAPESRLVKRHLKNSHDELEMEPIANVVVRRADFSALHDKCFPGRPKRLSNITISDDGRRTKCKLCLSTISRKRRLTHTLEKHMSMPSYGCSACQFTHNWDDSAVTSHIKSVHSKSSNAKASLLNNRLSIARKIVIVVLCLLAQFEAELRERGQQCFPDWVIESSYFE
ncbi:zinc finger, C2H2 type [Ancylostoma caninum]|uniref:Zinc finger, C2H2 type n=1 Tax=Ancylostoma caninum TaxID=29170 RepID=A0A368G139_ANCCA|nr:zinc finger, C2H2 type [Ancylostoma caninum]